MSKAGSSRGRAGASMWARLDPRAVGSVLLAALVAAAPIGAAGCASGDAKADGAAKPAEKPAKVAPAEDAAAPAPPAPAGVPNADAKASLSPPGNPVPDEVLDRLGKEGGVRATEEKAMAQHYYEVGKRFYEQLEYEKAYDALEKAVTLDPTHAAAVELYQSAGAIIGKRQDELKAQIERWRKEFEVKVELTRQEMIRFFESGEKAFNAGDYEQAIREFERVKEMIAWYPYKIDTAGYLERTEKLINETKKKKREADLHRAEELEREALEKSRAEQKRKLALDRRRVATMLEQTGDLIQARRYRQARDLALEILEIEPTNPLAKKLHDYAVEGIHLLENERLWTEKHDELIEDRLNMTRVQTPREGTPIRFPDDWQERTRFRRPGIATAAEEEPFWVRNYKKILKERKVSLTFPDVPLKDVVIFLQDVTGLNFVIGQGIDPEEKKVSLRLKDIVLENALKIILDQTKLIYIFDKESIIITEPGAAQGEIYFEIYDVSDILFKIPDFTAPRIDLPNPDDPAGGAAGGGGSLIFDDSGGGEEDTISGDTLIEVVKGATGGDEAWGEGTSIEPHQGQLLVNNVRDVHVKIAEILDNLRRNQGLFVHIETRFISVENDALEDIGVDFRGLGGHPGDERGTPGSTNPFGTPQDLDIDPNARGGTDAGVAQRNGTPGLENFIGRAQHIFDGAPGALRGARLLGGGGTTLLITALDPFQFNAIIRAEGQTSKVRRLTAPRVTAANREKVYVSVITQRAYIADWELVSGGTGLFVVEVPDPIIQTFQEGVVLEVRPTISSDRKFITLDVRPALATLVGGRISTIVVNLGSFTQAGIQVPIGVPEITLEEAFTSVTIPDGGTALLGGFRQVRQTESLSTLPFVDSIPIVNTIFKRRGEIKETQSLVILITAKIVSIRDEEERRFNKQK